MYIEDFILNFTKNPFQMNKFDLNILTSFGNQLYLQKSLTEKQADLAIKILKKQIHKFNSIYGQDILPFLENPQFKFQTRVLNQEKSCRIVKKSPNEKIIVMKFPFSNEIIKKIRENRQGLNHCVWDADEKHWELGFDERSLKFLSEIYEKFQFTLDDELADYIKNIKECIYEIEKYVPVITFENSKIQLKNIPNFVPDFTQNTVLQTVIEGRKLGINTWDDTIDEILKAQGDCDFFYKFISNDPGKPLTCFAYDYEKTSILNTISRFTPTLILVPSLNQLAVTKELVEILMSKGISANEITVLFRLPTETGLEFNNFVKDYNLNNPLNEHTKVVFVNVKIPKTILKSKIKFHSILNYNCLQAHYTVKLFVDSHENVINYFADKKQKGFNFDEV